MPDNHSPHFASKAVPGYGIFYCPTQWYRPGHPSYSLQTSFMKLLYTLVFVCTCCTAFAKPTFEKLTTINQYWLKQTNVPSAIITEEKEYTGKELIALHLSLVEQALRAKDTKGLSAAQKANRKNCLDHLHEYWLAGNFPINEDYSYRTPIFIDNHDNFCAVGYLIKASGNEAIIRKIAANTNDAYVKDMRYPELGAWANEYGFSINELAWIQPTYSPVGAVAPIGKGTDGEVIELYVNNAKDRLYVGGRFTNVDSTIPANNIAYITEAGGVYTWHNMRGGVNGKVNAITEFEGRVYVAGSFTMADTVPVTNVAYWDGANWHNAGCTYGEIKDLVVYKNELYAAGRFDVCAAMADVNFAVWDTTYHIWHQMWSASGMINGRVNTMYEYNGDLLLGGLFAYNNDTVNAIKWNNQAGFQQFANKIKNEVNDFKLYQDSLYVACKLTSSDSELVRVLRNNAWGALPYNYDIKNFSYAYNGTPSFQTLCVATTAMMLGGNFIHNIMVGTGSLNCTSFGWGNNWFSTDSAINKLVVFKNQFIAGGKFKYDGFQSANKLNSIARQYNILAPTAVNEITSGTPGFKIYPNPSSSSVITIENDFNATGFGLYDLSGKLIMNKTLRPNKAVVTLPELAAGVYFAEVKNDDGVKVVQKLVVE